MRTLIAAAWLLFAAGVAVPAERPSRSLSHYTHRSWSEESDAPRPAVAIAQDSRGYLWIGAASGLYRFDGIRFERIGEGVDPVTHGPPSALLVRRNGELWTNFERSRRFAVYRGGRLRWLRSPVAPDRIAAMAEAPDGTIWALTERIGLPLLRYRDGRWTRVGTAAGAPMDNPFSMAVTADGTVWVSFTGSVARLDRNGTRLRSVKQMPGALGRLSIDPEGRIWITERRGTYPLTGPNGRGAPPPLRHAYATDSAEIRGWPRFDREGNLWIATYYDGVQRIAHPDPRGAATRAEAASRVEHFTARDGLSSNVTSQVFQDTEGHVWAATANGLDKFWPATFRFERDLADPAAFGDLLLAASDGSVYIGQASTVYRVRPGGRPEPIFRTSVEPRTLCEGPDKSIWIGTGRDVTIWRNGRLTRLPGPAPVNATIFDCAFDSEGDYWVTASLGGMARFRAGKWERMFGKAGAQFLPKAMAADARGRILFQWNDRTLARLDGHRVRTTALPLGDYEPDEVALYPAPGDRLFAAGRFGIARLKDGRFQSISPRRMPLFSGLSGMVEAPGGDSWLAGPGGVLRVSSAALDRALADPGISLSVQHFGPNDGLVSPPHDHSRRSIVRGGDGRLWVATQTGTVWLDPASIARTRRPPRVSISSLTADRLYRDPADLSLPPGTRNVEIDFAVLDFSNPRAGKVRYRIEGQDSGWVEAGTRRQAFYTNLAPGSYRFRLVAANEDGIWNATGATLRFEIAPTFVQSRWFLALCLLAALVLLWLVYRLRLARVAARIRSRLAERLGERERIARELHDTLLQSVQGLILRFQSVANKLPADGAARAQLEEALKRADDVIAEGRNRVYDLRGSDRSGDLAELLRSKALEAGFDPAIPIRIVVEGRQRAVHPLVAAELGQVASEALFNAARHSGAAKVEIAIRFGAQELAVDIRDDGEGIAADVLEQGHRPGHFGLVGMRERAERIGGRLSLESRAGGGSSVALTIPARLAYVDTGRRSRIIPRLFGRNEGQESG